MTSSASPHPQCVTVLVPISLPVHVLLLHLLPGHCEQVVDNVRGRFAVDRCFIGDGERILMGRLAISCFELVPLKFLDDVIQICGDPWDAWLGGCRYRHIRFLERCRLGTSVRGNGGPNKGYKNLVPNGTDDASKHVSI